MLSVRNELLAIASSEASVQNLMRSQRVLIPPRCGTPITEQRHTLGTEVLALTSKHMRLAAYACLCRTSFHAAMITACLVVGCSLDRDPSHIVVLSDSQGDASIPVTTTIRAARPVAAPARPSSTDDGTAVPSSAGQAGSAPPPPAVVDAGSSTSSGETGAPDAGHTSSVDAGAAQSDGDQSSAPQKPASMPATPCGGPCPSDRPHCLPSGTCGACASDADCSSERPRCDATTFACVQCVEDLDCNDLKRPQCSGHQCTRCTSDAACIPRLLTPICDVGEEAASDDEGDKGHGKGKKDSHTGECIGLLDVLD